MHSTYLCHKILGHSKIPNSHMGVYFESLESAPFHLPNVVRLCFTLVFNSPRLGLWHLNHHIKKSPCPYNLGPSINNQSIHSHVQFEPTWIFVQVWFTHDIHIMEGAKVSNVKANEQSMMAQNVDIIHFLVPIEPWLVGIIV